MSHMTECDTCGDVLICSCTNGPRARHLCLDCWSKEEEAKELAQESQGVFDFSSKPGQGGEHGL